MTLMLGGVAMAKDQSTRAGFNLLTAPGRTATLGGTTPLCYPTPGAVRTAREFGTDVAAGSALDA